MTGSIAAGVFTARDLSLSWRKTVLAVERAPHQKLFHTVTRIESPLEEDLEMRRRVDEMLRHLGYPSAETVANTIFPMELASCTHGHGELSERYRKMYPTLQRFPGNQRGTYFGRMVSYPSAKNGSDQLAKIITTMRMQLKRRSTMSTPYEMTLDAIADGAMDRGSEAAGGGRIAPEADIESPLGGTSTVYAPSDNRVRGFPCMSFISFQVDEGLLHAYAHYRYEYLIKKGYGNYLGIARLQGYVADQVGLHVGALTISAGRAHVDAGSKLVLRYLIDTPLFDA